MKSLVIGAALLAGILTVLLTGAQGAGAAAVCIFLAGAAALLISQQKQDKEFLLVVFFGGLALRMFCGLMVYYFGAQEFFGGDALTYDFLGAQLLKVWQGDVPYHVFDNALGVFLNRNWGMIYIVGGIYSVTGQNSLAVQFFCAVFGAATAPVVYLCAVDIYNNRRAARLAAYATAFFPSLILWSSQGLKDGPLVFLLALSMMATLRLMRGFKVAHLALLAVALFGVFTLRFYVFYMMAASVAGAFLIGAGSVTLKSVVRQVFIMMLIGLAMIQFGVLRSAGTQFEAYGNLEAVQRSRADLAQSGQSGFGRDVDVSTTAGALSAIPLGAVYLLFAPFPWQLASVRQAITLPEMLVWWAAFPLLVTGLWFTVKHRLRRALPVLVFTAMLTLAYSVFQGNVGTAYRQRSQLLIFYFVFAAVGCELVLERREDRRRREQEQMRPAAGGFGRPGRRVLEPPLSMERRPTGARAGLAAPSSEAGSQA
jgi:hypothetical protein